ncbi:hypothetical protein D3C80_1586300 [compost metagenome]
MNKQTFTNHFKLLLVHLNDLTSQYCFNRLSDNYEFIIEPSQRVTSEHLTHEENSYMAIWNKLENKRIDFDQVVNLLCKDAKMPKWVDCSVYYSTSNTTIVHLLFSRQFRSKEELYYMEMGTGPFKPVVNLPPANRRIVKEGKFDVNWRKYMDDEKESKWQVIKQRILNFLILSWRS